MADDEAKAMLQWLRGAARTRLATARDDADGERIVAELRTRAKKLGAMIAARCYDADDQAAQRAWSDLGLAQDFKTLPAADASTALRQLLAWEDARHA